MSIFLLSSEPTATMALEFDPAAEGTGSPLVVSTEPYYLTQFSAPAPPAKYQWAGSVDTEGSALASRGHENRTITVGLDVVGEGPLGALQGKLAKLHRDGGTLKYTTRWGEEVTFDVLASDGYEPVFDVKHDLAGWTTVQFHVTCKPYGRGAEQDLGDNVETTLPALVFTEASIPGDVPALGRLVIDNDQAVDQWWMTWGIQSRYYSSSANAALFYEAEGRTVLGASDTTAGPAGASALSVVRNQFLGTNYKAIMSTQATGAGAHLSHVGTYRVYVRAQVATVGAGDTTFALEWSEGDFLSYTRNAPVVISATNDNVWRLADLGLVTLRSVAAGTQRWEGRIIAKGTASDVLYLDYLLFIPVDEGSGIASGVLREYTPTSYAAQDSFTSTIAGNALNARVAPAGGTWATSGDATDLAFADDTVPSSGGTAGEQLKRSAVSDTNGRHGILGSTNYTNVHVEARIEYETYTITTGPTLDQGVIARWTDSSNYLRASLRRSGNPVTKQLRIEQVVAGVVTTIATGTWPTGFSTSMQWWKIALDVNTSGVASATVYADDPTVSTPPQGTVMASCSGSSSALAVGGTLATGKPGIWDRFTGPTSGARYIDALIVTTVPSDAAVFASQSFELRSDRVVREDSGGTLWVRPSSYQGDYLFVPPSGAESRPIRMVVKMARNDPSVLDNAIDDLSARLFVTPRYLAPPA